MIKRQPIASPRIFDGKKYNYGGFASNDKELKKEKYWFRFNKYLVRSVPHPQGSGYLIYVRQKNG